MTHETITRLAVAVITGMLLLGYAVPPASVRQSSADQRTTARLSLEPAALAQKSDLQRPAGPARYATIGREIHPATTVLIRMPVTEIAAR